MAYCKVHVLKDELASYKDFNMLIFYKLCQGQILDFGFSMGKSEKIYFSVSELVHAVD